MLDLILGGLCVAALLGWSLTLIWLSRSLLPMANSMKVHQAIVDREDVKVGSLVERVLTRQNRGKPPEATRPPESETAHPMAGMFRSTQPSAVIDDQPDAEGLEIVG